MQPLLKKHIRQIISTPFILGMYVPLLFLHLCVEIYQAICFPLYGIAKVPRSKYIHIHRHRLPYLDPLEKFNCAYCEYANGLMGYATAIIAETEKYWCPIRQRLTQGQVEPPHHAEFAAYGDEKEFRKIYKA